MNTPFLFHPQTADGFDYHDGLITVTLFTEPLNATRIVLRHEPDNEEELVELTQVGKMGRLLKWCATFPINSDRDVTHYVFKVITDKQQYWLGGTGVVSRIPAKELHFKFNQQHQPADWVSQQIFYQIFPDRFCNANSEIGVRTDEYFLRGTLGTIEKPWHEPPTTSGTEVAREFYNGDLAGIRSKLDYLQALGITCLYLNPIFKSQTNHKYDTTDYLKVDPHLGTNEEFAELVEELHSRGMKIVLDAVYNHTSTEHPWFDMSGKQGDGAFQSPQSPYREYYFFEGESEHYAGWKGLKHLPVLNFSNKEVQDQIYAADDAVIKHWLKAPYHIDGWRFDVIHMLGEGEGAKNNAHYVKAFRQATKSVNPQAYVLGEHFFEASQWLQGDQEDGAMNYYGFAHPVRALFANKDISYDPITLSGNEFVGWLEEARAKLPWANQLSQLNQLDSHDTARFLTLLEGNSKKMKLASILLATYVGVPCLYYGTEVGLEGGQDPDCRRPFPWDKIEDSSWLEFYRSLLSIRKQHKALQQGSIQYLGFSDDYIIFARCLENDRVITLLNLSNEVQTVTLPIWQLGIEQGQLISLQSETSFVFDNGLCTLTIEPNSAEIFTL